ncbi:MSL10, partial [Symbiodinium sp. KB8]
MDDLVDMDLTHQLRWAESAQLVVAAPPGMAKGAGPRRSFWPLHMAPHVAQSTPSTHCEDETHAAAYPTIHLASRSQAARAAKALFPILFSQVATCTPPPPGAVAPAPDVDGVDSGATRLRQRGSGDTRSPSPPETRTASVMVEAVAMPARQPGRALGLEHLETVLGHEEAGALLSRLDVSGDSRVSLAEFTEGIAGMWDSFATAQATLAGRTTVSSAVSILVLDVSAVLLPLSAVLLAVSFAIGPSVSRLVASLTFVLGVRPFDVGERIVLQNVLNGGKLDVLAVGVMSCTFKFAETGAHVTIGNDVLSTMPVQNLSRAATTTVLLPCKVPSNITSAQLAALERWLQEHCRQYSVHWGPAPKVYVLGLSHGLDGTVDIMLYLQYQRPPAQSARLA